MKMRAALAALSATVFLSVSASAFYPSHHLSLTLGALEGAGFSEGQAWMIAYFNIEVDLATELPEYAFAIVNWPTSKYVCVPLADRTYPANYDACAPSAYFADWAERCLPFHCPGPNPAKGIAQVANQWRRPSMAGAMHPKAGERSYDWLQRVGWMLHAAQDFYAHTNWIEVFHVNLGFDFREIPSWTSFMKSQRGEWLNLILLDHANNDVEEARRLYNVLDQNLVSENHDQWNKDSDDEDSSCYEKGSKTYHQNVLGHNVEEFHRAAAAVAGAETYQIGLEIRMNIENNPDNGAARWSALFRAVEEMAAYDGLSYEDELDIYQRGIDWFHVCAVTWSKWQ